MIENGFGIESLSVFLEAMHEVRALHTGDVNGPVVNFSVVMSRAPWARPVTIHGCRFARDA
jgi:hypothetical protein